MKQRSEEEHVTVLLQVLSSYVNPSGGDDDEDATCNVLTPTFLQLLANSSLLPALSSYLRNDSGNLQCTKEKQNNSLVCENFT